MPAQIRLRVASVLAALACASWALPPRGATAPAGGIARDPAAQDPVAQDPVAQDPRSIDFARDVRPVLARLCLRCHGPEKQKGDVRLDTLDPAMAARADAEGWHAALDMLRSGEMPPDDEPQPSDQERRLLVTWLDGALAAAADRFAGEHGAVLRRLTRAQYTHALQDVLGIDADFGRTLPADALGKGGFSNDGGALHASPLYLETCQEIARDALRRAIATGPRPASTRYRVTFGRGIGAGRIAGHTGGYQSVPLSTDDFVVELLDERGAPVTGGSDEDRAERERVQRRISVGLRGSGQDRFRVVDEGMILLSALPHREVVPQAWQGPSPNLKLEMQRCWPREGAFAMRVVASRGYVPPLRKELLVALDDVEGGPAALAALGAGGGLAAPDGALVLSARQSDQRRNLREHDGGDLLLPVDVPKDSKARLGFAVPEDGFYQVDLVHPLAPPDAMPSVRLRLAGHHLDQRLQLAGDAPGGTAPAAPDDARRVVTPLGVAGLRAGRHHLEVGGPFFVGFSHVVVTPLGDDHPLVVRLTRAHEAQDRAVAHLVPSIRPLIGTRTDDGMDYTTFDEPQDVLAPLGEPATYEFRGRLEDLPIPAPDSGDTEVLSGFLLLGLWNDHLVKSPRETGPPLCVRSIEFEAPLADAWPPASHRRIFFDADERSDDDAYAEAVLRRFVGRAFRRPARDDEVSRYAAFFRDVRPEFGTFEAAMQEVLVAVLCSPEFLFLCEPEDELGPDGALADWMLANRLAFFLWNGPPDDELRRLADAGRLREELLDQVDRLLDDPRSERFVRRFTAEWLRLDRHDGVTIDVGRHRDYTRFVQRDMRAETIAFVHHVLRHDLPVETFVAADFALWNQNLAEFYGLPDAATQVPGQALRPVPVPASLPERRAGLLSHGAFLAGHSDGREPHPIKRAVWLKARLLGDEPPPPPPNVPDLDPDTPGFDRMTLKQKLEAHRDHASCRDCHAGIDPYGFAFERLSAVGRPEPERNGLPVDATSTLPDGSRVDGLAGMQQWLLGRSRDALTGPFVEHLFAYALGREVRFADERELDAIEHQVRLAGRRARAVVRAIVASPSFLTK